MKVLIAGASGMVGGLILQHCLESDKISQVISLVRKESSTNHEKLSELVVNDFADYSGMEDVFSDVVVAFFTIGVYTGQVPDDQFKIITVDYAVEFAKAVKNQNPNATYCLLSGAGADQTEKSKTSFARYKGMSENQITALGLQFYSFRPAYIYPVQARKEPNVMYSVSRFLYPLIRLFGSNASIKSTELARAMFTVGVSGTNQSILENRDIINLINE
ncbi:MAG: NAD(P)H-binding protein [Bacteroidota bacterium]